jgi:hypothetical protein
MMKSMDIAEFEQRVRERAYALWESEGRQHGRHEQHWLICEAAIRAELASAPAEAIVVAATVEAAPVEIAPAPAEIAPAKRAVRPKAALATEKPAAKKAAAAPRKKKVAIAKSMATMHAMSPTLQ